MNSLRVNPRTYCGGNTNATTGTIQQSALGLTKPAGTRYWFLSHFAGNMYVNWFPAWPQWNNVQTPGYMGWSHFLQSSTSPTGSATIGALVPTGPQDGDAGPCTIFTSRLHGTLVAGGTWTIQWSRENGGGTPPALNPGAAMDLSFTDVITSDELNPWAPCFEPGFEMELEDDRLVHNAGLYWFWPLAKMTGAQRFRVRGEITMGPSTMRIERVNVSVLRDGNIAVKLARDGQLSVPVDWTSPAASPGIYEVRISRGVQDIDAGGNPFYAPDPVKFAIHSLELL